MIAEGFKSLLVENSLALAVKEHCVSVESEGDCVGNGVVGCCWVDNAGRNPSVNRLLDRLALARQKQVNLVGMQVWADGLAAGKGPALDIEVVVFRREDQTGGEVRRVLGHKRDS